MYAVYREEIVIEKNYYSPDYRYNMFLLRKLQDVKMQKDDMDNI